MFDGSYFSNLNLVTWMVSIFDKTIKMYLSYNINVLKITDASSSVKVWSNDFNKTGVSENG